MWNDAWADAGTAGWGMAGWSDGGWWWSMIGVYGLVWLLIVALVATALADLIRIRIRGRAAVTAVRHTPTEGR